MNWIRFAHFFQYPAATEYVAATKDTAARLRFFFLCRMLNAMPMSNINSMNAGSDAIYL